MNKPGIENSMDDPPSLVSTSINFPVSTFTKNVDLLIDEFTKTHYWQTARRFAYLGKFSRQYHQFCLGEIIREKLNWSPQQFTSHINREINGLRRYYGRLRPRDLCSPLAIKALRIASGENLDSPASAETEENWPPDVDPKNVEDVDFDVEPFAEEAETL